MVRCCLLAVLVITADVANAQDLKWPAAGERVAITLKDSRTLEGVVTADTTPQLLSLTRTSRGIEIESDIPREKIATIEKLTAPEIALPDPSRPAEIAPPAPSLQAPRRDPLPKVRSLAIRAHLANWDNDPEPDGLLVDVSPLDANGAFVPIAGNIDLELYGQRHQQGAQVFDDRASFLLLDRNAKIVRSADAGAESYSVRLPFRRFHPDRNLELNPFALVRARFSVPGQGVFEAADDWTVIRASSRFRDDVQQLTGKRYLSPEQTRLQTPFDIRRVSP
jgi:hypothetical protein